MNLDVKLKKKKFLFVKSLAFLCTFILLSVSILGVHGSAMPVSNNLSFSDKLENIGGDIKEYEEENNISGCEEVGYYENGNSIINSMVDVNDANDDTDFDYSELVNCTNAPKWDTDSDSLPDGYETLYGLSPSIGTGPDGTGDYDGDGLSNPYEYGYGMDSGYNPSSTSFNNKTLCYLPRGVYWDGLNPASVDSDADGISDGLEDSNHNGVFDVGETDPLNIDSDSDGLSDGIEISGWEIFIVRTDGTKTTVRVYGNPNNPGDRDGDGLNDYQEFVNCTNPDNHDTDSDGISDNVEIANRSVNPQQYNPNIQDSLPPTVKNVKISMSEHWTSVTVTIIPSVTVSAFGYSYTTPAVTASVSIIDGISIRVTADIWDASGVYDVTFTKESTVVDGLLVSGNTFNAGFFLGISLGSLIKLVSDISVGFTVKVKAYDYLNNWNESEGSYDGPFTTLAKIAVTILAAAWNALCEVGEKIKDAVESLISWVWDVIENMINAVLEPIEDSIRGWVQDIHNTIHFSSISIDDRIMAIISSIVIAVTVITVVLLAIEIIAAAFTGTVPGLIPTLISFLKPLILTIFIGQAMKGTFDEITNAENGETPSTSIISDFFDKWIAGLSGLYSVINGVWSAVGEALVGGFASPAAALAYSIIALIISMYATEISSGQYLLALDVLAALLAIMGVFICYKSGGFALGAISWVLKLESILTLVCAISALVIIISRAAYSTYS